MASSRDDEEARAALWRQQTANRIAYQVGVWQLLQAPPEPRLAVMTAWEPVLMAIAEREAGPIDPEDDP